ncbi:unnamed protein product [Mytilus coruscus]|uniref:Mutator-like transposase domain-containing protein n=1 Tax=Mytilus coruscus TaxID=42192 RepID=A0A6J8B6F1_MYTCO|nr:unnamed protein product [Mytilus coruscus]
MSGFKKGNIFKFKAVSIPHNKKRTKLMPVKNDYDTPKYKRLTMKKYNLAVNDPHTDPEEKARRPSRAAKLQRPKSDEAGSIPHNKKRTKLMPVKNDYDTPKYKRLTMKKYNLAVNDPYTDPEEKARRSARAAKLLRPKSDEVSVPKKKTGILLPDFNSYRTVCVYKMEEMWNKAFREHQQKSPACEGKLSCDLEKEEKRGFSSRQTLICTRCSYISEKYSLYEELETGKPGRKPSKLDTAVHVGLSQTPIASSSMRKIILSGNMQAPAASSLQRRANKVLKKIVDVNKMDLKKRLEAPRTLCRSPDIFIYN